MENIDYSAMDQLIKNTVKEDGMKDKFLTFWIEKQFFAIPISDVVQIVQMQPITEIPEFPVYAKGIINLRESIIPVIDVRLRLEKDEISYTDHTCIIVTNIEQKLMGLIVDGVNEVTNIAEDEIAPPPNMSVDYVNTYLTGIARKNNKVILILDAKKILSHEQMEVLQDNL